VSPGKELVKNPTFHKWFMQDDDDWNLKPDVLKQLEHLTCLMYAQKREVSVEVVRAKLRRKMVGED